MSFSYVLSAFYVILKLPFEYMKAFSILNSFLKLDFKLPHFIFLI